MGVLYSIDQLWLLTLDYLIVREYLNLFLLWQRERGGRRKRVHDVDRRKGRRRKKEESTKKKWIDVCPGSFLFLSFFSFPSEDLVHVSLSNSTHFQEFPLFETRFRPVKMGLFCSFNAGEKEESAFLSLSHSKLEKQIGDRHWNAVPSPPPPSFHPTLFPSYSTLRVSIHVTPPLFCR